MNDKIKLKQWKEISEAKLKDLYYEQNLSDYTIAEIYGVTKNQVRYKRNKFGISIKNKIFNEFISQSSEVYKGLNNDSKARLLKQENIDGIAKALTHYAFRNGPVEDMHANGKLTQEDMKILNKYMVNRLAGIMYTIYEEKWLQLELIYEHLKNYGTHWEQAEPDTEDLELIWNENLKLIKNNFR
ncbi:hypothetical protein HZF24_04650 [Sedimentibacter hydroxybenzoicus DSM 7310]|uniref:Uncharacterized protein n=1 Tax=Sedimentibacter hydroxybenzoicus DSM 7310 TaxID=1123245 RepID=A0A974BIB0_SEDHY|nr:hypothetical protein [Sedimentibacter hydroxybenzoicus]NYB73426.1 hypothetical protein [Sedimentibacter hydroxybenzoicus DSM 7310]